jgi:hypothetical protein
MSIRIVSLAELNDPDNFSQTDKRCMRNPNCLSGPYWGRSFFVWASTKGLDLNNMAVTVEQLFQRWCNSDWGAHWPDGSRWAIWEWAL